MVTQARLHELFHYDPLVGVFTRLTTRGSRLAGTVAGSLSHGYIRMSVDGREYFAHRLAWLYVHGIMPPEEIDHRDLVRTHNWIGNLRLASTTQNKGNYPRARNNTTGFKGVNWRPERQRFRATISVRDRSVHLGYFETAQAAHDAYLAASRLYFGPFARAA